jgi:4-oxalocrotonate tautomerase
MPVISIELMAGISEEVVAELLDRAPARFAELIDAPIERIRARIDEVPANRWRVGGRADAEPRPLIRLELMRGRPAELIERLMAEISALVAEILDIPVLATRLLIQEVDPAHWAIGGIPAGRVRADEVEARATARAREAREAPEAREPEASAGPSSTPTPTGAIA